MGDHFVLLVDRLLTESTLEAALERESQLHKSKLSENCVTMFSSVEIDANLRSSSGELVECRICHDEDEELNMETPCSCRGSLKYAHRKCVQRWCNEKGDIMCEICLLKLQQFKPDYTAPPPPFHCGGVSMNLRGNWEISGRDLHSPPFIAMVASDHEYENTIFSDYPALSPGSRMCCRVVAITFIILLVLRHTLPIMISGEGDHSMTLFTLLILKTIGVLLPICFIIKALTIIQRRRRLQASPFELASSDEESDFPHPRPQIIQI